MNRPPDRFVDLFVGFFAGLLCGLLGAGGGLLLLPVLRHRGLSTAQCHATMLAVTVPLAVVSGAFYLLQGHVSLANLLPYLPGGLVGAAAGSLLLPKIRPRLLRLVFALFLLYSGLRFSGILALLGVGG
ncbi:MAG: sulfite exporter TauE/SafE family protein [Oscillospiraceae bacterium]|nr:sulfite exporter TauE/SafE family protein [Oscillospiraceae bacterium]